MGYYHNSYTFDRFGDKVCRQHKISEGSSSAKTKL